jgi:RHS repeat-associated protein
LRSCDINVAMNHYTMVDAEKLVTGYS